MPKYKTITTQLIDRNKLLLRVIYAYFFLTNKRRAVYLVINEIRRVRKYVE